MCLGFPGKIVSISEEGVCGTVDIGGTLREVSLMILPEEVSVGDYVMVHVGFAISKMDKTEAEKTLATLMEYFNEDFDKIQRQ